MSALSEPGRFVGLDGLRGVAALAVLIHHSPDETVSGLVPSGFLAVDLFFLLSGFVLTYAYEGKIASGLSLVDFMRIRLVRLYPLYLLATLLAVAVLAIQTLRWLVVDPVEGAVTFLTAVLFLPSPPQNFLHGGYLFPINPAAWSLFFEIVINLVFVLIVPYLNRAVLAVTIALGLVFLVATVLAYGTLHPAGVLDSTWLGGFGRVIFSFFAGVALSRLWRAGHLAWLRLPSWLPMVILMCVFAVPAAGWGRMAFELLACVVLFPALVLASANVAAYGAFARFCLIVGAASYAVYVLQTPMMYAVNSVLNFAFDMDLQSFGATGTVAFALLVFFASLAADAVYDAPVRHWLTKKLGRRRQAVTEA